MDNTTTTVLYALSTIAQTCAALAAFVGAVGVFRLQSLLTSRERIEETITGSVARRISKDKSSDEIVKGTYDLLANSPDMLSDIQRANLLTNLPKLKDFPRRYNRARSWLIRFEVWNLAVICLTLIGFSVVPTLACFSGMSAALLCLIAVGTTAITVWCVAVWTRETST